MPRLYLKTVVSIISLLIIVIVLKFTILNTNGEKSLKWMSDWFLDRDYLQLRKIFPNEKMFEIYQKLNLPKFYLVDHELSKALPDLEFPTEKGQGEQGSAFAMVLNESQNQLQKALLEKEAVNVYASDRISLFRSLPDARPPECFSVQTIENLPNVSIIITFHNEVLSLLLRTLHSVVERTPQLFIHEIILVDDASEENLTKPLQKYIYNNFKENVKLLTLKERSGLIQARLTAAAIATGKVLVFLDSHCEVITNWLEPLLRTINLDKHVVACPVVNIIDPITLAYYPASPYLGGFSWDLSFQYRHIPDHIAKQQRNPSDNLRTPAAGDLYAIDREWFWSLGGFDPELRLLGLENIELSFKAWMCGGSIEIVPCSKIAHLIIKRNTPHVQDPSGVSAARIAEVWLDSYKENFYIFRPDLKKSNFGDVSERKDLRAHLDCKTFKWYLDHIYPDKFLFTHNVKAWGWIKNEDLCLKFSTNIINDEMLYQITLEACSENGNQIFSYTSSNQLRREEMCFDIVQVKNGLQLALTVCSDVPELSWIHERNKKIKNEKFMLCLDADKYEIGQSLFLFPCVEGKKTQDWTFQHYLNM